MLPVRPEFDAVRRAIRLLSKWSVAHSAANLIVILEDDEIVNRGIAESLLDVASILRSRHVEYVGKTPTAAVIPAVPAPLSTGTGVSKEIPMAPSQQPEYSSQDSDFGFRARVRGWGGSRRLVMWRSQRSSSCRAD